MSIEVQNITKIYGTQKALNDVSFSVGSGEIVGFLGPNGAGQSTMMKILTCYIPPSSGNAKVCGYDVSAQSLEVRRHIGYLPEHNPLYLDMYVREFLEFAGGLHKIPNVRKRAGEMIGLTGLEPEQNKKIGALSKGYRQRVGIAQAMIHDPKVLIMDEPTTGLDPNQLEEIRSLIRTLGKEKSVMLSTHIMQEVEAICDRVIIVDRGQLVANDATTNLRKSSTVQIVTVEFDSQLTAEALRNLEGVDHVKHLYANTWQLTSSAAGDIRKVIFDYAVSLGLSVLTLTKEEQKIEDVFKDLTRRRDQGR
jgi:ABC-2 type transport system ATP-binding protein